MCTLRFLDTAVPCPVCGDLLCNAFIIIPIFHHPKTAQKINTLQKVDLLDLKMHNIIPAHFASFMVLDF